MGASVQATATAPAARNGIASRCSCSRNRSRSRGRGRTGALGDRVAEKGGSVGGAAAVAAAAAAAVAAAGDLQLQRLEGILGETATQAAEVLLRFLTKKKEKKRKAQRRFKSLFIFVLVVHKWIQTLPCSDEVWFLL